MMLNRQSGALVAILWIATLVVAVHLGSRSSTSATSPPNAPSPRPTSESETTPRFNRTQQRDAVNRLLTFTRELGGDELARILPEITDKMIVSQVRQTMDRLEEEIDPSPARRLAQAELIGRWAQLDPESTLAHIEALNDPKARHDFRLRAIEGWASIDPAAALEHVKLMALAEEEIQDELGRTAEDAVWAGLTKPRDFRAVLEFVPTLLETDGNVWSVPAAARELFKRDDRAIIRWIENLEEGFLRDQAAMGVLAEWRRHDPEAADKWEQKLGGAEMGSDTSGKFEFHSGTPFR